MISTSRIYETKSERREPYFLPNHFVTIDTVNDITGSIDSRLEKVETDLKIVNEQINANNLLSLNAIAKGKKTLKLNKLLLLSRFI